jgi:hypothetical protein
MDRTDDIRNALNNARQDAWAAKLRFAYNLLSIESEAPLARAILGDVLRELEPPVNSRSVRGEAR